MFWAVIGALWFPWKLAQHHSRLILNSLCRIPPQREYHDLDSSLILSFRVILMQLHSRPFLSNSKQSRAFFFGTGVWWTRTRFCAFFVSPGTCCDITWPQSRRTLNTFNCRTKMHLSDIVIPTPCTSLNAFNISVPTTAATIAANTKQVLDAKILRSSNRKSHDLVRLFLRFIVFVAARVAAINWDQCKTGFRF